MYVVMPSSVMLTIFLPRQRMERSTPPLVGPDPGLDGLLGDGEDGALGGEAAGGALLGRWRRKNTSVSMYYRSL